MPIYETPRGWKIKNVKGYSPSKEAATKRLQAIKAKQQNYDNKWSNKWKKQKEPQKK